MADRVELTEVRDKQILVYELVGELDLVAAPAVRERLLRAAEERPAPPTVVLDLRGLTVLSAAGLRALVEVAKVWRADDVGVSVVLGDDSPLLRTAGATDLTDNFDVVENLAAALDHDAVTRVIPLDDDRQAETADGHAAGNSGSAATFALLTERLLAADTVGEVLSRVVQAVSGLVPDAAIASITLRDSEGRLHTPTSNGAAARQLDTVQYRWQQGPCYDVALPTGPDIIACDDLAGPTPWPRFASAAALMGLTAVVSTALIPGPSHDQVIGALNVYSETAYGLDRLDRDALLLLATHASLALANTTAVTEAALRNEQLHRALASRDVIGQAKGIIMARRGVNADEAFDVLRRASQELNVKLVDLAKTLANRHTELDL